MNAKKPSSHEGGFFAFMRDHVILQIPRSSQNCAGVTTKLAGG